MLLLAKPRQLNRVLYMKHLIQHFNNLTLHPKNVTALKGLILQLAVQGKLTENWRAEHPDVESGEVLLEKIYETKKKLVENKLIKNSKKLPSPTEDELYFEIPKTWVWERIGNIGEVFNGNSVNKNLKAAKYEGLEEGYPYIGTKDVGYIFETINEDNGVKIPFDKPKFKIAKKQTVLICSEGGSAGKKMGITTQDCCFGNKLYALEQFYGIDSVYILCLYGSNSFWKAFSNKMTGIIGGISRSKFVDLLIPIPPLQEQKAIVAVVEELFSEVEQLEQKTQERIQLKKDYVTSALHKLSQTTDVAKTWQDLQAHFTTFFNEKANIKSLRESILQLAVQGKLTKNWRKKNKISPFGGAGGIEPASELLKRITAEKKKLIEAKAIKKEKPLPKITEDEKPFELPEGWVWCRMIELCQFITDGTHQTPNYIENGRMFLSAKNVKPFRFMPEIHKFVSEEDFEGYRKNRKPEFNDILLTRVGAGIGEATRIDKDLEFAIYVSVCLLKMFPNLLIPDYLVIWLNSPEGRQHSKRNTYGKGVSQGNLNLSLIRGFVVSLPPLEEQKAIVELVDELMAYCDGLEREVEQRDNLLEDLMASCLVEMESDSAKSDVEELGMVAEDRGKS